MQVKRPITGAGAYLVWVLPPASEVRAGKNLGPLGRRRWASTSVMLMSSVVIFRGVELYGLLSIDNVGIKTGDS